MWQAIIRIMARNPPSISIAGGVVLHLSAISVCSLSEELAKSLMGTATTLVILGVFLQVLWLIMRRGDFDITIQRLQTVEL